MEKHKFKAGVIQFDVENGRIQTNMERAMGYLGSLADQGVSLAVMPELFTCGFDNENIYSHAGQMDQVLETLKTFAADHKVAVAGTLPELLEGSFGASSQKAVFNTFYFIDTDGSLKGKYRKLHLFPLTLEHHYYRAGNDIVVLDTTLGRIGLMICYDLRFPELARKLFLKDAQMILVSAQWPKPRVAHWQTLTQARAIENQLFMICANRTGTDDAHPDQVLIYPGNSMIVDPMGDVLVNAGDEQGVGVAQIDFEKVVRARQLIPCRQDMRADIYG